MAVIKPIRTDGDLEQALERIDQIFDAEEGTPESDELDVLTVLVEHYEDERHPIGFPTSVAAVRVPHGTVGADEAGPHPLPREPLQGFGSALR